MKNFINNPMSPSTYVNLLKDAGFKAVYADKSNKSCLINLINCIRTSSMSTSVRYKRSAKGNKTEAPAPFDGG